MPASETFPYDVYRFLRKSLRDGDTNRVLERFFGGIQEDFERTHGRIRELSTLTDPAAIEARFLAYILALVGWHGTTLASRFPGLPEDTLRKLALASRKVWKSKGTASGYVNAIRVLTGRTASFQGYFRLRALISPTGPSWIGRRSRKGDTWILSGDGSDHLRSIFLINRAGLTEFDARLMYDLFKEIWKADQHTTLVYVPFFDDFTYLELSRWNVEDSDLTYHEDASMRMEPGGAASVNVISDEMDTWRGTVTMGLSVRFTDTDAANGVRVQIMRQDAAKDYDVRVYADGTIELYANGVLESSTVVPLILTSLGEPVYIEIQAIQKTQIETDVVVRAFGEQVLSASYEGSFAYVTNELAPRISRVAGGTAHVFIDDVVIVGTDTHTQEIGWTYSEATQDSTFSTYRPLSETKPHVAPPTPLVHSAPNQQFRFVSSDLFSGVAWQKGGDWNHTEAIGITSDGSIWWNTTTFPIAGSWHNRTVEPNFVGGVQSDLKSPPVFMNRMLASDRAKFRIEVEVIWHPPLGASNPVAPPSLICYWETAGSPADPDYTFNVDGSDPEYGNITPPPAGGPSGGGRGFWRRTTFEMSKDPMGAGDRLVFRATPGATYVSTGWGIGIGQVAIYAYRE